MSERRELKSDSREALGLPQGWTATSVGSISDLQVGFAFKSKEFVSDGIRLLRGDNIEPGALRWDGVKCWPRNKVRDFEHLLVHVGDVILAMDRPVISTGLKIAAVRQTDTPALLVQRVARLRSIVGPNAYLRYAMECPAFRKHISDGQTGTMLPHISGATIKSFDIWLAPLPEQHRIVAEIEKHFTRLDAAVATLERVQASLKQARASVLKAAVEGRLVPTEAELARAEGRTYEPASVLLERILVERKRKHEEVHGKKKYKSPVAPDTEGLPELPEGWTWASVDQLSWSSSYGTSVKCDTVAAGPPVLRIPNLQRGAINLEDLKFSTDTASLRPDGAVEPGDLLFVRTNGSLNLIGRGAIVNTPLIRRSWFASYLIRLRLCGNHNMWRWVGLVWNSRIVRRYIERDAASSAGQFNVSLSTATLYQVPVPPLSEQARILAEVEHRLSVFDTLDATIQRNLARCTGLRQSILKRAFSGKLVPQDPSDEPASVLLAWIQSQSA